jgi:hypothetical protein
MTEEFDAAAREDFLAIALSEFGEPVEYQMALDTGMAPWKQVMALVMAGDPGNPLDLGTPFRRGPDPIEVRISKDPAQGLSRVSPRKDLLKRYPGTVNETLYQVVAILRADDPGSWRLHAVTG